MTWDATMNRDRITARTKYVMRREDAFGMLLYSKEHAFLILF
jgi:hypothetical protein